jgi:hypothetical protein
MKEAKNESRRLCFGFRSKVGRAMTISDNTHKRIIRNPFMLQ